MGNIQVFKSLELFSDRANYTDNFGRIISIVLVSPYILVKYKINLGYFSFITIHIKNNIYKLRLLRFEVYLFSELALQFNFK